MTYEDVFLDIERELARQKKLQLEGQFMYLCDSPTLPNARALSILTEETGEVARAVNDYYTVLDYSGDDKDLKDAEAKIYEELIQVAAVAVSFAKRFEYERA